MKESKTLVRDLPDYLFKEINAFTSDSTVALYGYSDSNKPIKGLISSGSLVTINSIYGILTAKHVWTEFRRRGAKKIAFVILGYNHFISERLDYLKVRMPENEVDICFIEIPPPLLGMMTANRTFFPIDKNNMPNINLVKDFLWITVGFPAEIQPTEQKITKIYRYYTHVSDYRKISESWDIIELDVDGNDPTVDLPKSFGGMSGGGIWNFNVFYKYELGIQKFYITNNPKNSLLVGVNYYETILADGVRKISGVGPISIYVGMTELVK